MRCYPCALFALLVMGCSPLPEGVAVTGTPSPLPTRDKPSAAAQLASTAGRTLIEASKGKNWLMEAAKVTWNDPGRKARVQAVDWTLRDKRGYPLLRVKAPAAWYRVEDESVDFDGKVHLERYAPPEVGQGAWEAGVSGGLKDPAEAAKVDVVDANKLVWYGKKGVLVGSKGVRWVRGSTIVEGDRMTATDKLQKIHLEGNVRGHGIFGDIAL